jgi:cell division protein FtsZ
VAVAKKADGRTNFDELERPAVIRKKAVGQQFGAEPEGGNMDYLDIPAFLRRQAD